MTPESTIYKVGLQIADADRHHYINHALIIAYHPSENDKRMIVRVPAFARYASETLAFAHDPSESDGPEFWQRGLTDTIELWIDLGNPDDTRIRKASNRAEQAAVCTYSGNTSRVWWQQTKTRVTRFANISVYEVAADTVATLTTMVGHTMRLQITIQDGDTQIVDDADNVHVRLGTLKAVTATRICSLITHVTL